MKDADPKRIMFDWHEDDWVYLFSCCPFTDFWLKNLVDSRRRQLSIYCPRSLRCSRYRTDAAVGALDETSCSSNPRQSSIQYFCKPFQECQILGAVSLTFVDDCHFFSVIIVEAIFVIFRDLRVLFH